MPFTASGRIPWPGRALIADQAPDLAGEPVLPVQGGGTTNTIFRVGRRATARFPRERPDPEELRSRLEEESAAAVEFARASSVTAPEPLLVGAPGHGYPLPWALQTWLEGQTATPTSDESSLELAEDLAALVGSLREWETAGRRFRGAGGGGTLADHDDWVEHCIQQTEGLFATASMQWAWARFRALPRKDPDLMNHTDLIPGNVLVADGRLVGVLDTGDLRAADPALDLVSAWHLLGPAARERLRTALGCDALQWERGAAWAFKQAAGAYWYYHDTNPNMAAMGRTTLERVIADV